MTTVATTLLGSFTTPMQVNTTPASLLWLLPLVAAIAVVYKATKVNQIRPRHFIKETAILFGSIIVFIVVAAVILHAVAWFASEQLPGLMGGSAF